MYNLARKLSEMYQPYGCSIVVCQ